MPVTSRLCRIELLGALRVVLPDRAFDRFRTQKTALLLAYLAHHSNRPHPREHLIALLWPEADLDAGRDSLTTALTSLRRQLEPAGVAAGAVIEADRQKIRLNPDAFTTDVAEFERLLAVALSPGHGRTAAERATSLREAVALYRGEFLAGFYEDWVMLEQARLAERYREALLALAAVDEHSGDLSGALAAARKALSVDPYGEDTHHLVMRLQARQGQPTAAIETYQQLEQRLRDDLNAAPGSPLRDLAEQIRREPEAFRSVAVHSPLEEVFAAPPAAPLSPSLTSSIPISLPLQTTGFFGRKKEREQLAALLTPASLSGLYAPKRRLVTLTGPGGVGKTRLAIETARELASSFSGGVWFVSLADVPHPRLLLFALAHALQINTAPAIDLLQQIVEKLSSAPSLLLLDNFEHLLQDQPTSKIDNTRAADASVLARLLLERAPQVSLLITSRRTLNLGGEQEFPVDVLATPPAQLSASTPQALLEFASVALYQDRAQYVLPDFAVTPRNAEAVGRLCRKLEGMPLAIEMAAAWVKTLSPSQMLERLASQLDLLVSRRRDLPARQRSLRATIEWSYDLLSPELQELFARLAVFRGGWDLKAAEAITKDEIAMRSGLSLKGEATDLLSSSFVLDQLTSLVDKSLIFANAHEQPIRYRMLETIRQYAHERLQERDHGATMRARHRDYFLALTEEARPNLQGPEQADWLALLEVEHDNLCQALTFCLEDPAGGRAGLQMAIVLSQFWLRWGRVSEGRQYLKAVLSRSVEPEDLKARADALNSAGALATRQGDYVAARTLHEDGLAIRRRLQDKQGIAQVLNDLGNVAYPQGDYIAARALYEESLAISRELQDRPGIARALSNVGLVASVQGDYRTAHALYEESLTISRELQDKRNIAYSLHDLASLATHQGDYATGRALFEESLAIRRELQDKQGIAHCLHNLGGGAVRQGDYVAACALYEESLAISRELQDKRVIAYSLDDLGYVAALQGNFARARALLDESLTIRQELQDKPGIALAFTSYAFLANQEKQAARAARLWGAITSLRETIGAIWSPADQETYEQQAAQARAILGEAAFVAAFEDGRAMDRHRATAYALSKSE